MSRWQVEQMLRYGKSELGMESGRLRDWKTRRKLLAIVSLFYAFSIDLLGDGYARFPTTLLRWAHRTGRHVKSAWRCLYRLRSALASLWQRHTPSLQGLSWKLGVCHGDINTTATPTT